MSGGLGKVLVVNTTERGGGAEVMASSILDGFQALGTDTWMGVGIKHTDHPRVVPLSGSPHVDYRPYAARRRRVPRELRRRVDRALGLEHFSHPNSHHLMELTGAPPDLVLCANLHGGYFDLRVLAPLSRQVPVVLKLADSWLFTGHCAVPRGCPRWETGCGSCPDLTIPPAVARDATRINWHRKRRMFAGARFGVVSSSRWMMDRARRSLLGPAITDSLVLPNGVDLDVFSPGSRAQARRALGIDDRADVLVFVCNEGRDNPYKDHATLRAALARLAQGGRDAPLELLVVGREAREERVADGARIRHLAFRSRPEDLAPLYRAADLYVHAAPEETFCLTIAEALACGTPVVAAVGGGAREVVEHGRTGLLAPPGDDRALAEAAARLLADRELRDRMGRAAAAAARARFDRRRMVRELHAWCGEVARRWR